VTGQPSMTLAPPSRVAGAGDSNGTTMDEVALAYTDPFPILMTHRAHDGIFTLLERRKKLRIEPVAPPGRQVPSLVAAVRTLTGGTHAQTVHAPAQNPAPDSPAAPAPAGAAGQRTGHGAVMAAVRSEPQPAALKCARCPGPTAKTRRPGSNRASASSKSFRIYWRGTARSPSCAPNPCSTSRWASRLDMSNR